jgi:hypothetical protein
MPAVAAKAGTSAATSGSTLASLGTVAFALDTARGDLTRGAAREVKRARIPPKLTGQ